MRLEIGNSQWRARLTAGALHTAPQAHGLAGTLQDRYGRSELGLGCDADLVVFYAPGRTRTSNLLVRSQPLYPIELRAPLKPVTVRRVIEVRQSPL